MHKLIAKLSLDWWAVLSALTLVVLVKTGAVHRIPW